MGRISADEQRGGLEMGLVGRRRERSANSAPDLPGCLEQDIARGHVLENRLHDRLQQTMDAGPGTAVVPPLKRMERRTLASAA